jgi:Sulfotransferase family
MTMSTVAPLTIDALCTEAQRRLGPDGCDSFEFLEALEVLSDALEREAGISPANRGAVQEGLIGNLVIQGRARRNAELHPEITQVAIDSPVFIIGLMRSGSTLLHNLLSEHPGLRCPMLWELMMPAGERDAGSRQRAITAAQDYVVELWRNAPALPKIHYIDALRPDECHRLLVNTFESRILWLRYRVPSHASWLIGRDLAPAYEHHRLQLQNILWRVPGGTPVLKCPFHVWSLDALVRVYPDARFIYLHRDPTSVVASTCSLSAELRSARCDTVDRKEIGPFWLEQCAPVFEEPDAVRAPIMDSPVIDVRYPDLVCDPIGTAARICDFIGVPMTDEAAGAMRRYLTDNVQHKHGVHRYTAEEFGICAAEMDERFAQYRRTYDL